MESVESSPKFKKIIFDLDGVITSERHYWNSAAMTVYEKIFEDLNIRWCEENIVNLSDEIFLNDETIVTLKNAGVNSNIDLAYILYLGVLIAQSKGVEDREIWEYINEYYNSLDLNAPEIYDCVAEQIAEIYNYEYAYVKRYGELWLEIEDIFQHWYFGDEKYKQIYKKDIPGISGKTGFIEYEEPILKAEELKICLSSLKEKGYVLGIATGRNDYESSYPLKRWGLWEFFDASSVATYDTVIKGQERYKEEPLSKPHPYVFLKSAYPEIDDEKELISKKNENNKDILVVGDAGADIIAAQSASMTFAAVLTGVNGKHANEYFVGMGADFIADDVIELEKYL